MLPLLAFVLAATPVVMPGEAEAQRFKDFFEKGESLYQQGDYGLAIYYFKRADEQRVTPEVAYDLAKSYEKIGDQAFSIYYFRLYMKRAPNAPDTLNVAEQVGKALAKAEIDGRGFLELDAPRASSVSVRTMRFPEPPVALFLTPGEYEVDAAFPAGQRTMKVVIKSGQTTTVSFEPLRPPMLPVESALPPEVLARGTETGAPPRGTSGLRVGSYVVFGVAVAAAGVGAALGAMSASDGNRLKTDRTLTVKQAQSLADSANAKGLSANLLFATGGAAVVGGALMFAFSMPEPGMKSGGASP